ncbi:MAG: 5-formyltetrahydrofolate cyclo-ligase [Bacillota bacterium]|nr:5-formyltetrahydrofolate cyclo-ligase [Bacillota bacterium]
MKKELRKRIIAERKAIPAERQIAIGKQVSKKLLEEHLPSVICSYVAFRGEVDLEAFHREVLASGRILLLPYTTPTEMIFCEVDSLEDLILSPMGIPEPNPSRSRRWTYDEIWAAAPFVATPGVAFTPDGYRMGYGGGYYDRFFAKRTAQGVKRGTVVGICHKLQVLDALPIEEHDIPVDRLCFISE